MRFEMVPSCPSDALRRAVFVAPAVVELLMSGQISIPSPGTYVAEPWHFVAGTAGATFMTPVTRTDPAIDAHALVAW